MHHVASNYSGWTASERKSFAKKTALIHKANKSNGATDWAAFRMIRKATGRLFWSAHLSYINDTIGASLELQSMKSFCWYKRSIANTHLASSLYLVGRASCQRWRTKSKFSARSSWPFSQLKTAPLNQPLWSSILSIAISTNGEEQLLRCNQPRKAFSHDAIRARLLKECASNIASVLDDIFRRSQKTSDVPADWRYTNIFPVFNKSDPRTQ